jgi:hypothetical protein
MGTAVSHDGGEQPAATAASIDEQANSGVTEGAPERSGALFFVRPGRAQT